MWMTWVNFLKTSISAGVVRESPENMSLTVQQLLSDAKRLTGRLRDHDSAADGIISAAQDVLKEVEAMRQYQEDIDSLNAVAHNRPRAQLVLGMTKPFSYRILLLLNSCLIS